MNDASSSTVRRGIVTVAPAPREHAHRGWVPETRFGQWFIGTRVWERYVVEVSIQQLAGLLAGRGRSPQTVLDAGSGPGVSLPLLDRYLKPAKIVAVDVDPEEVQRSQVQSKRCGCTVDVRLGNVAALEFPDESFDLILCHQTLHHVVDQEGVLRELYRVLAPGGALLLAESCREFILSAPVRALFRHPNHVQKSAAGYQQLLRDAGFFFTAAEVDVSRPFWSLADWGLFERLTGRAKANAEPTQVMVAAFKPGSPDTPAAA